MAQFLKARFLSEALKWKADPRHASDQFFAGLRYDPFLFQQARLTFPEYDKRFPAPANKEFAENFARDLANPTRNQDLLKIINPEVLTPELETANSQFEAETRLEQQVVAGASGQPVAQPFSLTTKPRPVIPRMPTPAQPQSTAGRPSFQVPRIPASFMNTVRNLGSRAGVFFQRNVGKYLTAGRVATVVSGGIGAITGGALTNGSAIGMLGGGGLGAIAPSWIRSGEGTRFLGKVGNGAINFGANLSNQVSSGATRLSMSSGSKKLLWGFLGAFILLFGVSLFGNFTGTTPSGKAGPLPPPGGGGGDIINCKFTRASNPQLIKSSILSGWISSAATTTGISPQVLASVAMHENQKFVAIDADNNHDAIKSNQFCNRGLKFCELNGQVLHSKDRKDDPCTSAEIANGARTAQAVGLMQLLDIYNPGGNLCSITENLAIAAAKLKADGITAQPTQDEVNKAIRQYYNSCTYGSYSYCNEVWQDYQNCKVQPAPPGGSDFASQLVDKIKKSLKCTGFVNKSNHDECIASIQPPPLPQLTTQEIRYSVYNVVGNVLQCVGFVQAALGGITGQLLNKVEAAYMYIYFLPADYKFTHKTDDSAIIKVGDLAVWNRVSDTLLPFGHIAYVVKVYDNANFDVAESNWDGPGVVGIRTVKKNETGFAGWAQKQ